MTGDNPIFIDQFGTGSGSHGVKGLKGPMNGEPMWKLAWRGHAPLWRAFWVYFVMGHGVILGLGCGVLVLSLLAGFIVNPSSSTSGMAGLAMGGGAQAGARFGDAGKSSVRAVRCGVIQGHTVQKQVK